MNFFRYTFEGSLAAINLTNATFKAASSRGRASVFYSLQKRSWEYALVAIFFCVCFQLLALAIVTYRGRWNR